MVGSTFTINFILVAFGVIIGAYLPMALIYLVSFFRRQSFGFILIKKAAARLAVIVVLFVLIFLALATTQQLLGVAELSDKQALFLGLGFVGSFLVGIILFIVGLARGRRRVVRGSGA